MIEMSGLGIRPNTTTIRVPIRIGTAIDFSAAPSRLAAGSRKYIALSTRT